MCESANSLKLSPWISELFENPSLFSVLLVHVQVLKIKQLQIDLLNCFILKKTSKQLSHLSKWSEGHHEIWQS